MAFILGCISLFSAVMAEIISVDIFRFFLSVLLLAVAYGLWLAMIKTAKKN